MVLHAPWSVSEAVKRGCERDVTSPAYTGDFRDLIADAATELWMDDHTHESRDFEVRSTRILNSAKGHGRWLPLERTWDNRNFNPNLVIEL